MPLTVPSMLFPVYKPIHINSNKPFALRFVSKPPSRDIQWTLLMLVWRSIALRLLKNSLADSHVYGESLFCTRRSLPTFIDNFSTGKSTKHLFSMSSVAKRGSFLFWAQEYLLLPSFSYKYSNLDSVWELCLHKKYFLFQWEKHKVRTLSISTIFQNPGLLSWSDP